jgi:lantibiotic leader peptide-processing serine protease
MKHLRKIRISAAVACLVIASVLPAGSGLAASPVADGARHVVVFDDLATPNGFAGRVEALGGSVSKTFDEIGVATVRGLTDEAARQLKSADGVKAVERDLVLPAADDSVAEVEAADVAAAPESFSFTCDATVTQFCARQWNLRKINAQAAWAQQLLGSANVKAFVVDTGIDYLHPDLVGLVDLDLSISLVSSYSDEDTLVGEQFPDRETFTDLHSHGTAIAGLISSNARHLAGVTQRTTLVAVKVHDRFRMAPISSYIDGIWYAARHDADTIHLSIPREFDKRANPGLVEMVNRAINYAHESGAVMVAAAGNAALTGDGDLDHDADRFRFCNAMHVICLSATGPTSAASVNGPWIDPDAVAPYTNFGRSAIDVAGPGGNAGASRVSLVCSQTTVATPLAKASDVCIGGGATRRIWASTGTSFAAGATSGLAALLVSLVGKDRPGDIGALIKQTADDLGAPGTDPYYGRGRINVENALAAVQP